MKNYYAEDERLFQSVRNLINGDANSYYVMYDLSIKYIYKIIYDIVKDYHATEDLIQETYITIYNKIYTLQEPTKFYSWAGRIATNLSFRYIQKNKRELLTLDSEEGVAEFAFEVATQDNEEFIPENILMDKEKQRLIAEIIDGLSVEQKITIQYFYYEEMSVNEIAEAMGCSRGTVMSRLNYARKAIKTAVVDLAENKGTRLYSLNALPLFYIVFRNAVEQFGFAAAQGSVGTMAGAAAGEVENIGVAGAVATEKAMMPEVGGADGIGVAGGTAIDKAAMSGIGGNEGVGVASGAAVDNAMMPVLAEGGEIGTASTAAGKSIASGVGKGMLGKVGSALGAKIAVGVVSAGLVVAGGVAIHNVIVKDDKPETTPMVIYMESVPNTETVDDLEDTFSYEYINVTYNNQEITIGFDSEIYDYGYESYETLSPELEQIHAEEYDAAVNASDEELDDVFDEEMEFTIDGEEFTLHVNDVEVEYNAEGDITTIAITGDCETPDNVKEIYEKYQTAYEEKLAALIEEATAAQAELDAKNELVREYYNGVLQDFYLYGKDPFGNPLEYYGDYYSGEMTVEVTEYAIYDIDGDGLVELIVGINQRSQGEIIYGYNPDTQVVVEEYRKGGGKFTGISDYYDSGFIVEGYMGCTEVIKRDELTDVYNEDEAVWSYIDLDYYVYGAVNSFNYFANKNDPECIAQEEELLNTYDKDGDGLLWLEVEYNENYERNVIAYYDNAELEAKINQVVLGGKVVELEFMDISTIAEDLNPEDIRNGYYMKIVEDIYLHSTDPFGEALNNGEWETTSDYAICDMDGDGVDELIVRYRSYVIVYEYDVNTMQVKQELRWLAENTSAESLKLYENGYALGGGGDPMYVMKLDTVSGTYEQIWSCDDNKGINWFQSHMGDSVSDEEYLALYDKDGDGIIYQEGILDENANKYTLVYYDNAELQERIIEVTEGNQPLNIEYIDMSTVVNQ